MKGEGIEQGQVWWSRSGGAAGTRRASPLRPQGGQGAAGQKLGVVPDLETRDMTASMVRRPVRLLPGPSAIGDRGLGHRARWVIPKRSGSL